VALGLITSNPAGRDDSGSCEHGYYTVEGDLLSMVTSTGEPLRGGFGERVAARPNGGSEKSVAMRLTLEHWRSARRDEMAGFNRPIRYQPRRFPDRPCRPLGEAVRRPPHQSPIS
jgi:hypothetical protein